MYPSILDQCSSRLLICANSRRRHAVRALTERLSEEYDKEFVSLPAALVYWLPLIQHQGNTKLVTNQVDMVLSWINRCAFKRHFLGGSKHWIMSSTSLSIFCLYAILAESFFVSCKCRKHQFWMCGLFACSQISNSCFVWNVLKEERDNTPYIVDSSDRTLDLLSSLEDDDEELRMLASLKREHEEDECRASGLSASQIHQCNVSISISTDDTSTWTHISTVCTLLSFILCLKWNAVQLIHYLQSWTGCPSFSRLSGIIFLTLADPHACSFPFQAPNVCHHKVLMHLLLLHVFCIKKDYGDGNALIGLLKLLKVH